MDADKIFITKFGTTAQYNAAKDSLAKPHVSLTKDDGKLHYMKYDYSIDYLTFVALESGTISFNIWKSMGTNMITSISYSKDNGDTWTTTNNVDNKSGHLVIDVNVNEGDEILWKGDASQLGYLDENDEKIIGSFFSSTCEFDAKGNVMSLLYGDDFKGETTIEEDYAFCYLFSDYNEVKICSIVNARNLSLPATTLTDFCYYSMFIGCTSLTEAPHLPATILKCCCYNGMFLGCTNLTTAPELPATTLASGCYRYMFQDCANLNYIKAMFTTTPSIDYTSNWVNGVSATGTFVKNSAASWNVSGVNGIPTGWTVETAE